MLPNIPKPKGNPISHRLVNVLQEAGLTAKAYPAQNKNHTTINADLGLPDDPPTKAMLDFLNGILKQ